jgi:hypothetical protein
MFEAALDKPLLPLSPGTLDFHLLWNQLRTVARYGRPEPDLQPSTPRRSAPLAGRRGSQRLRCEPSATSAGRPTSSRSVLPDDRRPYFASRRATWCTIDPRRAPERCGTGRDRVDWPVSQLATVLREADRSRRLFIAALPGLAPALT